MIKIGARHTIVQEIDSITCDEFLNKFHIQKTCHGQKWRYGLFYDNKIIAVMTFGYPRYDKYAQYELLRLCFHPEYVISGGSEKLFKFFIKTTQPKNQHNSIVSYCDDERFNGDVYRRLGFKCYYKPSKKQIVRYEKDNKYITAQELRLHGADQLIGTRYGKGISNHSIMLNEGWKPIYELGSSRWYYSNYGTVYVIYKMSYNKYTYIGQHIGDNVDHYNGSGSKWKNVIKNDFSNIKKEILKTVYSNIDANIYEYKYIQKDRRENPLYNCNLVDRVKQVITEVICSECGGRSGNHINNCSKQYTCNECGSHNKGHHYKSCSKFKIREVCSECGQLIHKRTCSKAKICPECKGLSRHKANCSKALKCSECNGANGRHRKSCSLYKAVVCSECSGKSNNHKEFCSKYKKRKELNCSYCDGKYKHKIYCQNPLYCNICHSKLPRHKLNCPSYSFKKWVCSECNGIMNHYKTCSKYKR